MLEVLCGRASCRDPCRAGPAASTLLHPTREAGSCCCCRRDAVQEARELAREDEGRGEGGERELEDVRGCDWE